MVACYTDPYLDVNMRVYYVDMQQNCVYMQQNYFDFQHEIGVF